MCPFFAFHSVKDEAYTADGGAGHQCYEAREFRTERQYDSEYRSDADNARVEYTGDVQHSGVLAVSGVGGCYHYMEVLVVLMKHYLHNMHTETPKTMHWLLTNSTAYTII